MKRLLTANEIQMLKDAGFDMGERLTIKGIFKVTQNFPKSIEYYQEGNWYSLNGKINVKHI